MARDRLIEELGKEVIPIRCDGRGRVRDFGTFSGDGLHVASIQAGATRGNHVHERDEIICIMGGSGICEIVAGGEGIIVEEDLKVYRIKAEVRHIIRNTGNREFYLVCFYVGGG